MQTLNNAELAFLAIASYSDLTGKAVGLCADGVHLYTPTFNPHLSVMMNGLMNAMSETSSQTPSKDKIAAEISELLEADEQMPEELLEKCDAILTRLVSGEIPSHDDGVALLTKLVQQDLNRKLSAKVTKNADILELQSTLDRSRQTLSELVPQQDLEDRYVFKPFKEMEKQAVQTSRIPTGINWMDDITSGGGRAGELWLILGSSGGGKTAQAVQYSCAQSLMGNKTLWATYEQSQEGDIAERIIACVTNESLDLIRDKGFTNLSPELQEKFHASVAGADENLIVLDMTRVRTAVSADPKDNGGMMSIWKKYRELKAAGVHVNTIIVDWIGAMMSLVGSVSNKDLTAGFRFYTQAEIDIARKMVKEEKIQIIFFHQTDSKSQHARPIYIPDKTCAKDMKDMCNYMDRRIIPCTSDKE